MRFYGRSRAPTSLPHKPCQRLKKLQAPEMGTELLRRSPRLKLLGKHTTTPPNPRAFNWRNATLEQITKILLRRYNKEHGTDLEYLRALPGKEMRFFGFGNSSEFIEIPGRWIHFNFEARRVNADPNDKPLVLFAELLRFSMYKYRLTTLSLVEPTDDGTTDESNGCLRCLTCISHPHHGFRAGLKNTSEASEPKMLSEQAASELSNFALQDYNKKNGTNIKFERALKSNSFTCTGLLMDLNEKTRDWVHMNFEARVGPKEEVFGLFAELYKNDDGKYVLATLSRPEIVSEGRWKRKYTGVNGCVLCPAGIRHPWHAYRFAFNEEPEIPKKPDFRFPEWMR